MVKVFFMIAEDKKLEEFLKILIERLNKYFDLEIKRIGEVEIEREKKLMEKEKIEKRAHRRRLN